ncbi:acyl-CoA dehydrogenase family protein [Aestuariivirga sp. YIM B02566]|uniref:Acyl-CoA dehydrogenase family protein n=1 Tax=Taklimakanibacter albus TaxID=2800327 RepID=A0ACC5RFD6_9HYPH|nr:acyl-CoA dehydrogenase family protein [Aestuariivirga sp. YIM B02566]MBK1871411.1 acyl-CoA dehydrogenase family protein [Aestuariivirga sp. YIM B02566]
MDFSLTFEQQTLVDALTDFVETELYPHEAVVEETRAVPQEVADDIRTKAKAAGYYAMNMPEELGGGGLDYQTMAQVERVLGKPSAALSLLIKRPTKILLGCKGDQVDEYLMPAIRGDKIDCFALTEPGAGSDARAIVTNAKRDGSDWVINGVKQFISHADVADFIILFAVTGMDETPKGPRKRFTSFLLDRDLPGLRIEPMKSICTRGYNPNMIYLDNVRVPETKILGEEGGGFNFANDWLYSGRVMLSAHCLGRAERVFAMACDWAANRKAFGKTIGEFQGTGFKIADMATDIKIAELMVKEAAWKMDEGRLTRDEASMVNLFASEMVGRVTDNALQIFGGMGVMEDFPIQRFWRDARIERIWEGTSEIHRDVIARDTLGKYRR